MSDESQEPKHTAEVIEKINQEAWWVKPNPEASLPASHALLPSEADSYVPAVQNAPTMALSVASTPNFPKQRTKRYDWAWAADMLAKGCSTNEVAKVLGCNRRSLYFALKRSPALRRRVAREQCRQQAETAAYVEGLRQDVAEKLAELAMEGNMQALKLLAEKLNLTQGNYIKAIHS